MAEGEKKEQVTSIYSYEERRKIVSSFLAAHLRGSIKVNFPTSEDIKQHPQLLALFKMIGDPDPEMFHTNVFMQHVDVVTGIKQATPSEVESAINSLFKQIMGLRTGQRIEGEFLDTPSLEKRIQSLEERITEVEELLEELGHRPRIQKQ